MRKLVVLFLIIPSFLMADEFHITAHVILRDPTGKKSDRHKAKRELTIAKKDKDGYHTIVNELIERVIDDLRCEHNAKMSGKPLDEDTYLLISQLKKCNEVRLKGDEKTYCCINYIKDISGLNGGRGEVELLVYPYKKRKTHKSSKRKIKKADGDKKSKDDLDLKSNTLTLPKVNGLPQSSSAPASLRSSSEYPQGFLPPLSPHSPQGAQSSISDSVWYASAAIVIATGMTYKALQSTGQSTENRRAGDFDKVTKELIEKAAEELLKIDEFCSHYVQDKALFEARWRLMNEIFKSVDGDLQIEILAEYEKKRESAYAKSFGGLRSKRPFAHPE